MKYLRGAAHYIGSRFGISWCDICWDFFKGPPIYNPFTTETVYCGECYSKKSWRTT